MNPTLTKPAPTKKEHICGSVCQWVALFFWAVIIIAAVMILAQSLSGCSNLTPAQQKRIDALEERALAIADQRVNRELDKLEGLKK